MSCKMLFFDLREDEKNFLNKHKPDNFDIKYFRESLNEETVETLSPEELEQTMVISVFITSEVTKKVVSKFKNLRIISTRSTGYDHIDLQPLIDKNIALINVESYGNISVAQFTFALILSLVRNLYPAMQAVKSGTCIQTNYTGRNLNALTLGVIGTGAIGAGVCTIAHAFGMKIIAYDLFPKQELEEKYNVQYTNLDDLLENADIISLHVPYNENNYHMLSTNQFKKMKQNSYLINVSRGELIDIESLVKFVKNGKLCGVGLDVVACIDSSCMDDIKKLERSSLMCLEESKIVKELNSYPNVIITPHIAYETQESIDYILEATFDGLSDFLYGGKQNRVI